MSVVGIDLGTSNSALALISEANAAPEIMRITQCVAPGKSAELELLPSALYLPNASENTSESFRLPWASTSSSVVGEYARERSATVPDRVVLSSKSWLCNSAIDRRAAILPWKAELETDKVSPLEASRRYLEHLRASLLNNLLTQGNSISLEEVVIAVPASFDEVARNLTLEAAEQAGFTKVSLIEEPLAAFYAWIAKHEDSRRSLIKPGDVILVCDVGGGTADFSLIAVSEDGGTLRLDRVSVGDHILLGGDNMDLALAVALKSELEQQRKLDRWQFMSLVQAARKAKESLFSDLEKQEVTVAIAGRGSSLMASALTTKLKREQLQKIILEGFLPQTTISEGPQERKTAGLQEYGLAYASDPALTKHLAHFLKRSLDTVRADKTLSSLVGNIKEHEERGFITPTKILFNGGVFKASAIRGRLLEILNEWCGVKVAVLPGADFDLAVARGAACYARIHQSGKGLRIRAKTLRSYYLGVESTMPAIPGYSPPIQAVCVVPQGLEEGSSVSLPSREFALVTGEAAEFRFFSSPLRADDRAGVLIEEAESELEESARLEVTLPALEKKRAVVPVRLEARVTEVGALELWLLHTRSEQRWKLEFNVRGQ